MLLANELKDFVPGKPNEPPLILVEKGWGNNKCVPKIFALTISRQKFSRQKFSRQNLWEVFSLNQLTWEESTWHSLTNIKLGS
jgi:hypothetical protein